MRRTEQDSHYDHLEKMSVKEILSNINQEDHTVAPAVKSILPLIEKFINELVPKIRAGGRLFYIGAGTSGRLGILDASECPPTFGVADDVVIGLIAGGDGAIRKAVEFAEDDEEGAWQDMSSYELNSTDAIVGLAASGTTPYVIGGLRKAQEQGLLTAAITCSPSSPITTVCQHPLVVDVGPEFLTGSTRMKSGTAQKMVLNMISTTLMIRLGKVRGNKMVDMQLANNKLLDRGARMIMAETQLDYEEALELLQKQGSVRAAIDTQRGSK